jgi:S1-C subfamily serine protease
VSLTLTGQFGEEGGGRPIEEAFLDDLGRPRDGTQAFFPIIRMSDSGPWTPIGTGFFISNNGLFATAKHVVIDDSGDIIPGLAGVQMLRAENRVIIREAIKIVVHPRADVAVGFLFDQRFADAREQTVNPCFALTTRAPQVGTKVVTIAFPNSVVTGNVAEFELKFATAAVEGTIEASHPNGRDSLLLPGRCFQTSMDIRGGASGGPVAYGDGYVFAINSTGMNGIPVSFVSSVEDLLDLEVNHVQLPGGKVRDHIGLEELVRLGLIIIR